MFKINKNCITDTYETGKEMVSSAVSTAQDISVRPKLYVGLRVRSKKQKDDIFGFNFHFDKEIPLLRIIGIAAGALAACIAIGALINGIFKCKKCKCDEDCGE